MTDMTRTGWRIGPFATIVVALSWGSAVANILVVETNVPWGVNGTNRVSANLTTLGIPFTQIPHSQFATQDLWGFDALFLQGSDGEDEPYLNLIVPQMGKVEAFVNGGGLAIIHFADLGTASPLVFAPLGVHRIDFSSNVGTIPPGKETDPLFNGLTDDDLDSWNWTSHGPLGNLPALAEILVVNENDDPIYARYGLGAGQVWVTTMPEEWYLAPPAFMGNELALAGQWEKIPEPATVGLLAGGLLALARRRRRAA